MANDPSENWCDYEWIGVRCTKDKGHDGPHRSPTWDDPPRKPPTPPEAALPRHVDMVRMSSWGCGRCGVHVAGGQSHTCGEPMEAVSGRMSLPATVTESGRVEVTPPEPAAPRVTPEDWQRLGEMQDTAREVGEHIAEVRQRFGLDAPEPDAAEREAEREARNFLRDWDAGRGMTRALTNLLRKVEARGRDGGLAEAERECERVPRASKHLIDRIRALRAK